jgi:pimeloyl-ACP methyl ester carboxylesterase
MSTFILVHGSWHGAWCWFKLITRLQRAGHRVVAPDLPGGGRDTTPVPQVTLQAYVDTVCAAIDAAPGPLVLVGHSRGGIVISQAAEHRPDRVRTLVYLAAFLIPDGQAMLPTALSDTGSRIVAGLELNEAEGWTRLRPDAVDEALYGDCSDDDRALAHLLLRPESAAPVATPLRLSDAGFGRIDRVYIETTRDRGVTLELQRRMQAALPCRRVITMATDHSPMLCAPDALAAHLCAI